MTTNISSMIDETARTPATSPSRISFSPSTLFWTDESMVIEKKLLVGGDL